MNAARSPHGALRLSAEARGMLPWCIVLSGAVHVLLLTSLVSAGPRQGSLAHAGRRSAGPVSVRLVTEGSAPRTQAAAMAPSPEASERRATVAPAEAPASAPASASAPAVVAPPAPADSAATDTGSMPGGSADRGYVPRPLLTIAPIAQAPVVIAMPPGPVEIGRRVGVLVLYIDEQGRVRHIEAEPPLLPPAMERAAREAFAAARFSPGQVDAQAVKSRIRVEVTFDAGSLPALSAAPAASGASAARAASAASVAGVASAASAPRAASVASAARASDQRSR